MLTIYEILFFCANIKITLDRSIGNLMKKKQNLVNSKKYYLCSLKIYYYGIRN